MSRSSVQLFVASAMLLCFTPALLSKAHGAIDVVNNPGVSVYTASGYLLGRLHKRVVWTATKTDGELWRLQRTIFGMRETVYLKRSDWVKAAPIRVRRGRVLFGRASPKKCRTLGLCNVLMKKGAQIPYGLKSFGIRSLQKSGFSHPLKVCRIGRVFYRLGPGTKDPDWLRPAITAYHSVLFKALVPQQQILIYAGGKPAVAPPCKARSMLKRKVGGDPNSLPWMGLFLLTDHAVARYRAFASKRPTPKLKARFFKLKSLASQHMIYTDRWCDDAVRQLYLLKIPSGKPARTRFWKRHSAQTVKKKWFKWILKRHALMYEEHAPKVCGLALKRMTRFYKMAALQGYQLYHQGY